MIVSKKLRSVKLGHWGSTLGASWPLKVLNQGPTMSCWVGPWYQIWLFRGIIVGNLIVHHNHCFDEVEIRTLKFMLKWCSSNTCTDTMLHQVQLLFWKLRSLTPWLLRCPFSVGLLIRGQWYLLHRWEALNACQHKVTECQTRPLGANWPLIYP